MDPNRAPSQYVRDRWGVENGLPKGPVYAIAQTTDGYLWIGTQTGLFRFDGINFRLFKSKDPRQPTNHVLGLTANRDGSLWMRLRRPTLLRYLNGDFEDVAEAMGIPSANVSVMGRALDGAPLIWALNDGGSVLLEKGKRLVPLATEVAASRSPAIAIAQAVDRSVWLGTRDAGLFHIHDGRSESVQGVPDPKVNCLLATASGELWAGTDGGVIRWDGHRMTQQGIPPPVAHVRALAMTPDRDGNIWIGTNSEGLIRVHDLDAAFVSPDAGAGREAITALFEDREGNIWLGSSSGLERLRDSVFVTYGRKEGLPTERNGPIYVDEQGALWFAPVDGGLYRLHRGVLQRMGLAQLGDEVIYSITGRGEDLWVGRQRGGLTHFHQHNGAFSATTLTRNDGLAENNVSSVSLGRDGTVWAGTLTGGLSRYRDGIFQNFTFRTGLASDTVTSILESSSGVLYAGTPDGLSIYNRGAWKTLSAADHLPSNAINCLVEDRAAVVWIGTANGPAYLENGRLHALRTIPTPLQTAILGIAADDAGFLWFSTGDKILRVNRQNLLQGTTDDAEIREFGFADGLLSTEGVKRDRGVVTDADGRIWFSTRRGISYVDPRRLTVSSAPALVNIQAVAADGVPVDLRNQVRIDAGKQRITFGYAGLSLSLPERVRFRYRLDGFDRAWTAPVAAREAVYTNLGPGTYRFRVIASNPDGVWNSREASVEFEIEPLYYQTSWFRLSVLVLIALSTYAAYRIRLGKETREISLRFEERLAERTRIAQELHDTLLQGFLSASMQLHVAADALSDHSPVKPPINRVLQLMSQVIEEARNAVRGLRSSETNMLDIERAFMLIPQEFSDASQVEYRVIVEGRPERLHPLLRDEVYRIGREALVNAFRHAKASKIEVELEYARHSFRLYVSDNGCGMDPAILQFGREGHWGLVGIRERAERIGGRIHLFSNIGAGTAVELTVPGHLAYARSNVRPSLLGQLWPLRKKS